MVIIPLLSLIVPRAKRAARVGLGAFLLYTLPSQPYKRDEPPNILELGKFENLKMTFCKAKQLSFVQKTIITSAYFQINSFSNFQIGSPSMRDIVK